MVRLAYEVATFTGASDISVIVSRTTGALGSTILGVLRSTIDGAELFFLSPGGIVIGDGAVLEVPGSVHFSTATTLRFGPDASFDLPTDIATPPALLSMAPPSAFGFRDNPAGISVGVDVNDASKALSVPAGQTLSFVGGDVILAGAPFPFNGNVITAPGATVQLAS